MFRQSSTAHVVLPVNRCMTAPQANLETMSTAPSHGHGSATARAAAPTLHARRRNLSPLSTALANQSRIPTGDALQVTQEIIPVAPLARGHGTATAPAFPSAPTHRARSPLPLVQPAPSPQILQQLHQVIPQRSHGLRARILLFL